MRRTLRIVLASFFAVSLAFATLTASGYGCSDIESAAGVSSGSVHGVAHDCGDPEPLAPVSEHHDCKMVTSCTSVLLSVAMLADAGSPLPRERPVALDDALPGDVVLALVAPPPRA